MGNTMKKILMTSALSVGMVTTMSITDLFADEFKAMSYNQQQKIEQNVQFEDSFDKQINVINDRLAEMGKSIKYDIPYDRTSMKDQIYQFIDAANSNGMLYDNVFAGVDWNNFKQAYDTIRKNMFEQLSAMTGVDYTRC